MNAALAERVDRLEGEPPGSSTASAEESEQAREQAQELVRETYAELVRTHETSALDASWAEATATTLDQDLSQLLIEVADASVEAVDCRSGSCVAKLTFPSRVSAQAQAPKLVQHEYGVNCATRIQLSDVANLEGPYQLELVFHGCVRDPA